MITDLAIDENKVAAQMAVAEIFPLAAERVIEKSGAASANSLASM
jgi:hypothetical protein